MNGEVRRSSRVRFHILLKSKRIVLDVAGRRATPSNLGCMVHLCLGVEKSVTGVTGTWLVQVQCWAAQFCCLGCFEHVPSSTSKVLQCNVGFLKVFLLYDLQRSTQGVVFDAKLCTRSCDVFRAWALRFAWQLLSRNWKDKCLINLLVLEGRSPSLSARGNL